MSLPPLLDVYDDVEAGKEEEGEAGGHEDEGDGPQVFVERDDACVLAASAQTCSDYAWTKIEYGIYK